MSGDESVEAAAWLELRGITKAYPGCLANDSIDLSISDGTIHALLGQNGAGKSTLVKIIYGVLQADSGTILREGQVVKIANPARARELGIAMVFQHFSLFESLTVLENISLGIPGSRVSQALRNETIEVSERYGLPLDPDRHVHTLSVGERQRIEIVRCLLQKPRLLIMDEPTSVLTPQEVETLFVTLRQLSDEGMSILYISHKLDEIKALCSTATILRDGRCVATADPQQESARGLASLMIGQELADARRTGTADFGEVRLAVNNLHVSATDSFAVRLEGISFSVRAGEILGVAGVAGNGQDELIKALSGESLVADAGAISISGRGVGSDSPASRRKLGLCTVPEERLGHATVPDMSLSENALLTAFRRLALSRAGLIKKADCERYTRSVIDSFDVQCRGPGSLASSLSGGNLQKFIVGREILQKPEVLVVSQPTWGVDAGAALEIHAALQELAASGAAILVISQDLDELMQISHNIMAICGGRVSAIYPTQELDAARIGLLMGGESLANLNDGNAAAPVNATPHDTTQH